MNLQFQHVSFAYPSQAPVLVDISFAVGEREVVLLLGRNGAGKSTLLKLFNGILRPAAGAILLDGNPTGSLSTAALAGHIAVTFQNPADQIFASTVREEISFGPRNLKRNNVSDLVEESLKRFGFAQNAGEHPYDLLPARRKLLTVASAIASDCPLLAFDEPSAGLSQPEWMLLKDALSRLIDREKSVFIVSHDLDLFFPLASRILILHAGRIAFHGGQQEFLSEADTLKRWGLRLPSLNRIAKMVESSG